MAPTKDYQDNYPTRGAEMAGGRIETFQQNGNFRCPANANINGNSEVRSLNADVPSVTQASAIGEVSNATLTNTRARAATDVNSVTQASA